ncbi:transcriptional regulator, TetR family (plasmid) [Hoeflea sp. IMCC20628]|uniref:TetR/AcrR family transcriptional regulator n=1 Tax=Hoeflea sp. IMCC20628 TaxID=1620421 RepID=UPI00063AD313|nr:TetR/AcrR family transcriptional regulator [Hoeflea sp. IMCC20628]AKI03305.1 transcriptional regulator, TetR family [Hoeflea sp. IMCC20628]
MPRAKHLPTEKRRNEAVEAVIDLAAIKSPEDITTTAIAGRMKLSQGALFRHFPTKDAIWRDVMNWVSDRLFERIDKVAGGESDPVAALEAMFMAHIAFVAEHPGAPRILMGQLQRTGTTPAKLAAHALTSNYATRLRRILAAGRSSGALPAGLDEAAAATLFLGMIQGLVVQALISGDQDQMRTDAPRVFAIYRAGILHDETRTEERG